MSEPSTSSDALPPVLPAGSMSHAWRALRHPNFRLYFFGQSISVIGTWMTRVATTWLVYQISHWASSVLRGR